MSGNVHVVNSGRMLRPFGVWKRSCCKQFEDAKAFWCLKTFMLYTVGGC